jgi:hypothetical protein
MNRDELIEAMAKSMALHPAIAYSAIEAAGFAIVPVVASEGMIVAGIKALEMMAWEDVYHDDVTVCHQALIQAAQEELK